MLGIRSDEIRYIAQDFVCNADGEFDLTLYMAILSDDVIQHLNSQLQYGETQNSVTVSAHHPDFSLITHFKVKGGSPTDGMTMFINSGTLLHISWPGVTRMFARIRIMENTSLEILSDMLADDIQNGNSISDVDEPERNQSFRPWSDDEESFADLNNHHSSSSSATSEQRIYIE
jgi:hypothetical protein